MPQILEINCFAPTNGCYNGFNEVNGEKYMRYKRFLLIVLTAVTIFSLAACNLPAAKATAKPAPTATKKSAATAPTFTSTPASPLPLPTDTQPVVPPTATLPQPPTATLALPPTLPATPTRTPAPTQGAIKPDEKAKFEGTFPGGEFTLRIGENGNWVILKTILLKGAECKEGKAMSESLNFEPPQMFPITDGKFSIELDGVTISGQFLSSTKAGGSLKLVLKDAGKTCTIGPSNWSASKTE